MADDKRERMLNELARAKARAREDAARPRKPLGERVGHVPTAGEMWSDVGLSTLSGARRGGEGLVGWLGDLGDLRMDLARRIAEAGPLKDELLPGIEKASQYTMPSTEDVGRATDLAVEQLPEAVGREVRRTTRHMPETPFGQAAGFAGEQAANLASGPETWLAHGATPALAMILGPASRYFKTAEGAAKLAKAKELAAPFDSTPEEVLRETGLFRQHGDWKREISDQPMQFSEAAYESLLGPEGKYEGYLGPSSQLDFFQPPASGLIEHPELFAEHPELADIKVKTELTPPWQQSGYSGSFMPGEIEGRAVSTPDLLKVIGHETQHAAQHASGLPRGGSPKDKTLQRPMQDVKATAETFYGKFDDDLRAFILERQLAGDPRNSSELARVWRIGNPEKARRMKAYADTMAGPAGPTAGYHHLAGETEARNVEGRLNLSDEERLETPPWETQDVPDELQIVRKRDQLAAMQPEAQMSVRRPKLQQVDATLGEPNNPDVVFQGKQPHEFTPGDWGAFGNAYGVPNLGPESDEAFQASLVPYQTSSGRTYTVPKGLESTDPFTYYDTLHMKAQGLDPNDLDPEHRLLLHNKLVQALERPSGQLSPEAKLNQLNFAMVSPNQPLTPNELAMSRLMVKGPEDIKRLAEMMPERGSVDFTSKERRARSNEIATQLGVQGQTKGGLGVSGSTDYTRIPELAQLYQKDPDWFRFRGAEEGGETPAEHWINHLQRLTSQVEGLSAKTGSLGAVFEAPSSAATSAVDRHMLNLLGERMFRSPQEKVLFERRVLKEFNKGKKGDARATTLQELRTKGGTSLLNDRLFSQVNKHRDPKMRLKGGELNPNVPETLRNVDWIDEPKKASIISEPYQRVLGANAEKAVEGGDTGLFSSQWRLWDEIRKRLEPHEALFPELSQLPRMSMEQALQARKAHTQAGYLSNVDRKTGQMKPVRSVANPSSLAYFSLPLLALPGGAAALDLMARPTEEGGNNAL